MGEPSSMRDMTPTPIWCHVPLFRLRSAFLTFLGLLSLQSTKSLRVCLPVTLSLSNDIVFVREWGWRHSNANQGREVGGGVGTPGLKILYFTLPCADTLGICQSLLKSPATIQIEDPAYGDVQGCIEGIRKTSFIINCKT